MALSGSTEKKAKKENKIYEKCRVEDFISLEISSHESLAATSL